MNKLDQLSQLESPTDASGVFAALQIFQEHVDSTFDALRTDPDKIVEVWKGTRPAFSKVFDLEKPWYSNVDRCLAESVRDFELAMDGVSMSASRDNDQNLRALKALHDGIEIVLARRGDLTPDDLEEWRVNQEKNHVNTFRLLKNDFADRFAKVTGESNGT